MQQISLEGKIILWVEDDCSLRELVAKRVVQEQCVVLHAGDGSEGIKFAITEKPDIIMLDIQLPGMDGFEILASLKADERTKAIPVIMLSNLDESENVAKARRLGAVSFLAKASETPTTIVEKIRAVLCPQ